MGRMRSEFNLAIATVQQNSIVDVTFLSQNYAQRIDDNQAYSALPRGLQQNSEFEHGGAWSAMAAFVLLDARQPLSARLST
jgi:hypothetical protein